MTHENPFRAPKAQEYPSNRERSFEDTPSFSQEERDAFVDYCKRAYESAPAELANAVLARWGKGTCDISFGGGEFFGWCHEPRGVVIEDAHLLSSFAEAAPFRDDLEAERWAFLSWVNNAKWTWVGGLHPATTHTLDQYQQDVRGNPAPAHARLPIPSAEEMAAQYHAWKETAMFPPSIGLGYADLELAGELMQALYDEVPVEGTYVVILNARPRQRERDRDIAGLLLIANARVKGPKSMDLQFATTGDGRYATNSVSINLHTGMYRKQPGARKLAYDELEAAGWIPIPDTKKGSWAPPEHLLQRFGLRRATPVETGNLRRSRPDAFVRADVRENPADDVAHDVARFLDSDKGPRRVVSRPRPPPAEDLPRAPPRQRRLRAPHHTGDADLADVHLAATGDGGAITRLAGRYRRFVRKMAYAFLRGWSPDAGPRRLAQEADEVAAEVEQRVFVGTERAAPAIKRYVVHKNEASFTTWLGAVTKNVARRHVRAAVAADRPKKSVKAATVEAEALDDVLDFEEREALARRGREQSSAVVEGMQKLQAQRGTRSRGDRRRIEDAGDELEVLRLRQEGKSYKEMAAALGITPKQVGDRLFRARRALEDASGIELRGLVGELRDGLGGAVPGKRGRPRKNPDDGDCIYFEDAGDVFDLLEAGAIDEDVAVEALEALAEYRPDAM